MSKVKRKILDTLRLVWKVPFLEKILVQWTKGRAFGSPITKLPPNHYQFREGTIRNVERDGISYELDLSDVVDWYIYFGFKERSRERLYELVRKGDVVFDVGANVGDVTMHVARQVGDEGKVHAFEPDPVNVQRIKRNLQQNDFENIELNTVGLGDEEGEFPLYAVDPGNKGMNRILPADEGTAAFAQIEVTTIDKYVERHAIDSIDLIKIDVEGFEFNVLKGATEALKSFKPILFIELDDQNLRKQGSSANEVVSFLLEHKYEVYNADNDKKIEGGADFTNCHFDVIGRPLESERVTEFDAIAVISNEPWGDVWYCKQHYAHELGQLDYPVYFIDPVVRWRFRDLFSSGVTSKQVEPNLTVVSYYNNFPVRLFPRLFVRLNDWLNSRKLKRYFGAQRLLWWQFDHIRLISLHGLNAVKRIYHVEDPHMKARNNDRLARAVDLIVCTSHKYVPFYSKYNAPALHVPHCISTEEFELDKGRVREIREQYRNCTILIGSINQDVDFEVLIRLAEVIDTPLLMIGKEVPLPKAQFKLWQSLKQRVVYLGPMHAKELKYYIAAASVCLVCYRLLDMADLVNRSPLKVLNYLAQYKPIVTSIDSEVGGIEGRGIYLADDREDFIRLVQEGLAGQLEVDRATVDQYLKEHTYEAGIEKILGAFVQP